MPRALKICFAVLLLLLAGCGGDLAVLGPTPPGEGIIIFIHADYRDEDFKGQSVTVTADVPNLRGLPGPCDGSFNDCARSIKVTKQ